MSLAGQDLLYRYQKRRKMRTKTFIHTLVFTLILTSFLLTACGPSASAPPPEPASVSQETFETPEWFNVELTDVQTGETFTMNDYAGKVVLVETMAIWCPNCIIQANEGRADKTPSVVPGDVILVPAAGDLSIEELETLPGFLGLAE